MISADWRERIAELRELAENTSDLSRRKRYLDLADRWGEFLEELESSTVDAPDRTNTAR
jgi:hypothetical protein